MLIRPPFLHEAIDKSRAAIKYLEARRKRLAVPIRGMRGRGTAGENPKKRQVQKKYWAPSEFFDRCDTMGGSYQYEGRLRTSCISRDKGTGRKNRDWSGSNIQGRILFARRGEEKIHFETYPEE